MTSQKTISTLFSKRCLVPVVVVERADDAIPLANALLEGGITSIEITLRTDAGLYAIEQVAKHVPDILIGAGTVIDRTMMNHAAIAGAQFQVSPGLTPALVDYANASEIVWLPGVSNASNVMLAHQYKLDHLKFFPAHISGGVPMLKQFMSVFPHIKFCPTGGINLQNIADYAKLDSVFAIGGSWLTPTDAIDNKDWKHISKIARESVQAMNNAGMSD